MGVEHRAEQIMSQAQFGKIVIFGVGLIGGSFSLALRRANAVREVVGFGRSAATLQQARELGLIDRIGDDVAREVRDADLILLATPVAQMADILARIAPHLGANTLICDGGSTKCDVVAAARQQLGSKIAQFVPAHPIAGAEQSGPAAARHQGPAGGTLYIFATRALASRHCGPLTSTLGRTQCPPLSLSSLWLVTAS